VLKEPKSSFNSAIASYHSAALVQRKVDTMLQAMMIKHVKSLPCVLELGCGDGVGSVQLNEMLNARCYLAVDIADALIDKAQIQYTENASGRQCIGGNQTAYANNSLKRVGVSNQCHTDTDNSHILMGGNIVAADHELRFLCDDFDKTSFWQSLTADRYDLIYSNMAMQWSKDFPYLFERIHRALHPKGILAFSIPLIGTFNELASIVRINAFLEHAVLLSYLSRGNWQVLATEKETIVLSFDSRRAQLNHLKLTGVNSYTGNETSTLGCLKRYLQGNQRSVVTLSYCVGLYVVARSKNECE